MLELLHVGRALKHHVLEKVGEARALFRLDAKANVVIDGDGDDGRVVVFGDDDAQAVRQFVIDDGDAQGLGMNKRGEKCKEQSGDEQPAKLPLKATHKFYLQVEGWWTRPVNEE